MVRKDIGKAITENEKKELEEFIKQAKWAVEYHKRKLEEEELKLKAYTTCRNRLEYD